MPTSQNLIILCLSRHLTTVSAGVWTPSVLPSLWHDFQPTLSSSLWLALWLLVWPSSPILLIGTLHSNGSSANPPTHPHSSILPLPKSLCFPQQVLLPLPFSGIQTTKWVTDISKQRGGLGLNLNKTLELAARHKRFFPAFCFIKTTVCFGHFQNPSMVFLLQISGTASTAPLKELIGDQVIGEWCRERILYFFPNEAITPG